MLICNSCKRICHRHYDFLALVGRHKSFLIADSMENAIEKTESLFQCHSGVCFSKAEIISRIFKEKGQSLSQISLDHKKKNDMKESCHCILCKSIHSLPNTKCTRTHKHAHTHPPTHTCFYCPVLCQPDQYFRHKWGELKRKEIHIEVWKHSRKKKTDPFKSTNTSNKSRWA